MAWTDYFVGAIAGSKVIVSADGRPFISTEIEKDEFVIIELTPDATTLPFQITFRGDGEERIYGYAGTKTLAVKLAKEVAELRLNSLMRELVVTPY